MGSYWADNKLPICALQTPQTFAELHFDCEIRARSGILIMQLQSARNADTLLHPE
jgi:hypothetical protein